MLNLNPTLWESEADVFRMTIILPAIVYLFRHFAFGVCTIKLYYGIIISPRGS